MSIPNYLDVIARLSQTYPDKWAAAHTGGPGTEDFIRLAAAYIYEKIDVNVGLNGKRGNPNDISDDALAIFADEGSVIDRAGRRMEIIDVIAGAGGPDPKPSWNAVGGPSPGAWVKPLSDIPIPQPVPTPTPTPTPTPSNEEVIKLIREVLVGINSLSNQVSDLKLDVASITDDILDIHENSFDTSNESFNAAMRTLDILDALKNGLTLSGSAGFLRLSGKARDERKNNF